QNDFFAMLRSWHNLRANPLRKAWKKLDVVLVTSTEPFLLIDRGDQSPFNVGEVLSLENFTCDQVSELNRRHGSVLPDGEVQELWTCLGGHPYLTRKGFYVIQASAPRMTLAKLCTDSIDDVGPFGDHLRNHLLRLYGHPELVTAMVSIVN